MPTRPLCTGTTATGAPCTAAAKGSTGRCRLHQTGSAVTRALASELTTPAQLRTLLLAISRAVAAGELAVTAATEIRVSAQAAFEAAQPKAETEPARAPTSGPLLDVDVLLGKPLGMSASRR